ncbi:N-alpha-acetyltransferase 20 [Liparis tanakae]|uniref:N-alpha-acetyltransferase 20 n=1 Tax=Liparis tanakae TaxID=230148 RepID=A0A4Z2FD52_9TELE|nr:N-alpha-acetyltransferase 20 [Liparis tanakae]
MFFSTLVTCHEINKQIDNRPGVVVYLFLQQPGPADGDRILPFAFLRLLLTPTRTRTKVCVRARVCVFVWFPLTFDLQYGIPFYLQYLAHWPEYFIVAEAPGGELMGYIMGKAEGSVAREEWHGHVTALSVAPEFRRLGLAAKLMEMLEEISESTGILLAAGDMRAILATCSSLRELDDLERDAGCPSAHNGQDVDTVNIHLLAVIRTRWPFEEYISHFIAEHIRDARGKTTPACLPTEARSHISLATVTGGSQRQ